MAHPIIEAYNRHKDAALEAYRIFKGYCALPLPATGGSDAPIRCAWRIEHGRTIEESAAREYLYRWNLAVRDFDQCEHRATSVFGAPHAFGL